MFIKYSYFNLLTNLCSIQIGGRKRDPGQCKLARKMNVRPKKQKGSSDKKRRISLFRRISTKIANAEIQQVVVHV
jgi:microtubule-associated serine/threonine kinase